jgi:hypothetical protein
MALAVHGAKEGGFVACVWVCRRGKKQLLGFWLARTFTQCDDGGSSCGSDASLGLRLRVGGSARFDRGGWCVVGAKGCEDLSGRCWLSWLGCCLRM